MQGSLSNAEMDELLSGEVFGHLACTDGSRPYIVPMAFVFHEDVLYGQTTEGKKVEMLRRNPLVCFQVQKLADKRWRSVICWGRFEEMDFGALQGPQGLTIVKLLSERIGAIQADVGIEIPFSFSETAAPMTVDGKTSTLFRIVVAEKTGRFFTAEG